jgi:hypothetical protein
MRFRRQFGNRALQLGKALLCLGAQAAKQFKRMIGRLVGHARHAMDKRQFSSVKWLRSGAARDGERLTRLNALTL